MSERSDAWGEYQATAHRLDAVRREAASVAAAEAEAVAAARNELPTVQARLGIQAGRLLESALHAGVAPPALVPNAAEQHTAARSTEGGPAVALAALRQARSTVDVADAVLARVGEKEQPQAVRNLIAYGPAAFCAMMVQLGFSAMVDDRTRTFYAAFCGLTMAAFFFGVAWLTLGRIYPRRAKTPRVGAMVCAAPVFLVTFLFLIT